MISEDVYNVVMKHKKKLNSVIDYSRDYNFDYFSYKTLERAYLMKVDNNKLTKLMIKSQVLQRADASGLRQYSKIKFSHTFWWLYPVIFYYCWKGVAW